MGSPFHVAVVLIIFAVQYDAIVCGSAKVHGRQFVISKIYFFQFRSWQASATSSTEAKTETKMRTSDERVSLPALDVAMASLALEFA